MFQNSFSQAEDKISYLDMNYIIYNSIAGKNIINNIELLQNKSVTKLKEREKAIKIKDNEIQSQKNILTKDELTLRIKILKDEIKQFNIDRENLIKEHETKKKINLEKLIQTISPYLEEYMKNNSIGIIINNNSLVIANSKYNITNDILDIVNKNIK
tara:strand:+ start:5979 stop:6449 length:471 start_codon:yes stop_codon:yes gene_type:complete